MSQKPTLPEHQKLRLKAHFGFGKVPFCKNLWVSEMFDSRSQRDAVAALRMWAEIRGLSTLTGPVGVGKSVTTRRFVQTLDDTRFRVVLLPSVPATPHGFLRAINRVLGLPMRLHLTDLFDQAQAHLTSRSAEDGPHPLLVLDDAEGTSVENLDLLRRLTAYALDSEDRFSVLLSGTDDLLRVLRDPRLEPLRSRIGYASTLRPFGMEDARSYVAFHLTRAGVHADLFTDDAVRRLFHASLGKPRSLNQLALQALIHAAVEGRDVLDGAFVQAQIASHPLYKDDRPGGPMSRDLRPTLVALVPRGWTPEQALRAVNLLQQAIAAIWVVHGQAMGRTVLDEPPPGRPDPQPLPRRPGGR